MNFTTSVSTKDFYSRIVRLDSNRPESISKSRNLSMVNLLSYTGTNVNVDMSSTSSRKKIIKPSNFKDIHRIEKFDSKTYDSSQFTQPVTNIPISTVYAVLTEGRANAEGETGLASIDINSPKLLLSQFTDNIMHSGCIQKLQICHPIEIFVPQTIFDNGSKALDVIRKNFSNMKITALPRRHFNYENGLDMMKRYCCNEFRNSINFYEKKYYAVTAAAALLKYLQTVQEITFLDRSLKIVYENRNTRMYIDHDSCHRLELLYPLTETKEKKCCLFGFLDNTITAIGKRFLRARILEPYYDINDIDSMQCSIKELLHNVDILQALGQNLKKFLNVDKIIKITIEVKKADSFKAVETMLHDILSLKYHLENTVELAEIIKPCQSFLLQKMHLNLVDPGLKETLAEINLTLRPEIKYARGASQCFQRIHAIRPGINEFLDMVREEYSKLTDELHKLVSQLAEEHQLPLQMTYSVIKSFHIQLQLSKTQTDVTFPKGLNLIQKKGKMVYFTNSDIDKLNTRISDITKQAYAISSKIIRELLNNLMKYIDFSYLLIETISNLDIINSLAIVSQTDRFCCPTFGDEMRIVNAIHPLLEYSTSKPDPVPNNIIATPEYNFYVITGPNMGGKTLYIKTIAILQIMAQLGCFVPARQAMFRPCDRIFTRIGFQDCIEYSRSSFTTEIQEMDYIFKNITTNSLVIIDELCRSTNPEEGLELSWKLCDKLCKVRGVKSPDMENTMAIDETEIKLVLDTILTSKPTSKDLDSRIFQVSELAVPFIFIATHFMKLTKLKDIHFNIVNLHLTAEEIIENGMSSLKYIHKVREGVTPLVGYGLILAKYHRFPQRFLSRAEELFHEMAFQKRGLPDESFNNANNSNALFGDLEKTLTDDPNRTFEREAPNLAKNISSFINKIDNFYETTSNSVENATAMEIINDLPYQLYDLYAEIAAIHRPKNRSNSERCNEIKNILESVRSTWPTELVNILASEKFPLNALMNKKLDQNVGQQAASKDSSKSHDNSLMLNNKVDVRIVEDILIKPANNQRRSCSFRNNSPPKLSDHKLSKTLPICTTRRSNYPTFDYLAHQQQPSNSFSENAKTLHEDK